MPLNINRLAALSSHLDTLEPLSPAEQDLWLDELAQKDPDLAEHLRSLLAVGDAAAQASFLSGVADATLRPPLVSAGERLGAWMLVEPIGEGGMGIVWRARRSDGRFDGEAAVKLLHNGLFDPEALERFRREGAILAGLHHPGIARLLDAGITEVGQPYLVLEFVDGVRIDHWCDAQQLTLNERVHLFLQVLDAVATAHSQRVIHRDLKPSNILVDQGGRVRLLDFGIARALDGEPARGLTREGAFALTPEYAAPEQFTRSPLSLGTDIYSLGVVLYELLTGCHPSGLRGVSAMDYMRAAMDSQSRLASYRAPAQREALRGDLDNILAHTLASEPSGRYATVEAFSEDLRRFLDDRPVSVRSPGLRERFLKYSRRNKAVVGIGCVAVLALLGGTAGTAWMAWRAHRHEAQALQERARANQERDIALEEMTKAQGVGELISYMTQAHPKDSPIMLDEVLIRSSRMVEEQKNLSPEQRATLLNAIGEQFALANNYRESMRVLTQALPFARKSRDPGLRAEVLTSLAWALGRGPRFGEARQLIDEALGQLPDHPRYLTARIVSLQTATQMERESGHAARSVQIAEQAVASFGRLDLPNPRLELDSRILLAQAHQAAGRLAEANHAFEQSPERVRQLELEGTITEYLVLTNWGLLSLEAGNLVQALRLFDRSRAQAKVLGLSTDPMILLGQAQGLLAQGQSGPAARLVLKAQVMADAMGDQAEGNLIRLNRLPLLRKLGDLAAADRLIAETEQRLHEAQMDDTAQAGLLRIERGLLHELRGQAAKASTLLDQGIGILEHSQNGALGLPLALTRRAEFAFRHGHLDQATADAGRALGLHQKNLGPELPSAHVGEVLLLLGDLSAAKGDPASARARYSEAARQFEPALGNLHSRTRRARLLAAGRSQPAPHGSRQNRPSHG
jgi:tetratricopeptide (TPR) repeat protein